MAQQILDTVGATDSLQTGGNKINANFTELYGTLSGVAVSSTSSGLALAKIAATLPAITIVDYCFHLAKDDTDKGAWRKRKGQSWRSEARSAGKYLGTVAVTTTSTNTAALLTMINAGTASVGDVLYASGTGTAFVEITAITGTAPSATAYTLALTYRAGREDYPTNALITAEASRVIIWDLDGAQPTMWMVFVLSGTNMIYGTVNVGSVAANNSVLSVGSTASHGVSIVDFVADKRKLYILNQLSSYAGNIAQRNAGLGNIVISATGIVSNSVNDVALTVLPDAPTDEYGMPVPNISAFTAGGVSEIKNDGTVVNSALTTAAQGGGYDSLGRIWWNTTTQYNISGLPTRAASWAAAYTISNAAFSATNLPIAPAITTATGKFAGSAIGSSSGLAVLKIGQGTNALEAVITNTFNSGFQVGDIRRCFLANSQTADRSVKAGTLTVVGTITETVNAGGRNVYSGFSATNYLQEASHADWNAIGTGDFSIMMSGVKWGTAGVGRAVWAMGAAATAGSHYLALNSVSGCQWIVADATAVDQIVISTTVAFTDTAEHVVELKRIGTAVSLLIDGVTVGTATSSLSISCATGFFNIGCGRTAGVAPWTGGQVACVRISATAPTAEQSKYIAATENALNGGATCLLSNSSTVSALDYKADTDLLEVVNGTATDYFNGLKRVASATTTSGLTGTEGQLPKYALLKSGTTNKFWANERNISAELQEQVKQEKRTQQYSFTSAATTQALPQGWKAQGLAFNTTDGTFLTTATQTFDGFKWTLTGLTSAKAYQVNLVEA